MAEIVAHGVRGSPAHPVPHGYRGIGDSRGSANMRFSLAPTLSRWKRGIYTSLRRERGFCGVTGRFETFPYGSVTRNPRFSGELAVQGGTTDTRFSLTPASSTGQAPSLSRWRALHNCSARCPRCHPERSRRVWVRGVGRCFVSCARFFAALRMTFSEVTQRSPLGEGVLDGSQPGRLDVIRWLPVAQVSWPATSRWRRVRRRRRVPGKPTGRSAARRR